MLDVTKFIRYRARVIENMDTVENRYQIEWEDDDSIFLLLTDKQKTELLETRHLSFYCGNSFFEIEKPRR